MKCQYLWNKVEYPSFAKFCEVIESFHGKITYFDGFRVSVEWDNAINRNHFEEHVFGY